MGSCQLCGKETDDLKKAKIEGAVMKVCSSCAEMGEIQEQKEKKTRKTKKKNHKPSRKRRSKVLTSNYGETVREEREDRELSIKELSDQLNEKASVIRKIEREEFKPDKTLASKIERELGIELYENPEAYEVENESGDEREATLGDVAEVK